jgi:mannose-1-phosphate guanylyltransferase
MSSDRFIVIMAGGRGERFWPQSRIKRPKQLLPIVGDKPLLTQTVERLKGVVPFENVLIITNVEQADAVREVCPMLPAENVVSEPVGRDTAAAVGLAMVLVKRKNPNAAFAMLPADHVIHDAESLRGVLDAGFNVAEKDDVIVTVGIKPTCPATGYGYIWYDAAGEKVKGCNVHPVRQFVEKPDLETAKEYLNTGEYYWNGGMFCWRVPVVAGELEKNTPVLWEGLQKIESELDSGKSLNVVLEEVYPTLEKISIDYAVMEKAKFVKVVESTFDWDDVGEWPAIERHYEADEAGNVIKGLAEVLDAKGNIVLNEKGHVTALVGVENLIVVQTADATLICPKDRAQDIKKIVRNLQEKEEYKHLM